MKIPVFHDDQHGTAIVVGAALLNALKVAGKTIDEVKLVASGAGAAALACLDLLVKLGLPRENIWVTDLAGVVYEGRTELMDEDKARFAQKTTLRTLAEVIAGADIFLGLSRRRRAEAGDGRRRWPRSPMIFALANPTPEILPEEVQGGAHATRSSPPAAPTTRTRSTTSCASRTSSAARSTAARRRSPIEMEIAAVHAIAELAQAEQSDVVAAAYAGATLSFGPEYLIPKPFDPRLMMKIAPAVAQAAADSGVALRPIADMDAYREKLQTFVYASGTTMKPIFTLAKRRAEQARRLRRGRGGARAARGAGGGRREPRAADADRPARR